MTIQGRLAAAAALSLACAACSPGLEVPAGAVITCSTTADCPAGRICSARGRCTDADDVEPPGLVGNAAVVTPARGKAGTAFTVTLEATEPLEAAPRAILGLSPLVELECNRQGASNVYACPFQATGAENGGAGGRVPIDVRIADIAGNERVLPSVGVLDLDFAAPVLAARSVEPAEPASVRLGGLIQVFFTTDEDLGAAPALVASRALDAGAGPATRFTPTQQPGTRNWVFTHAVGVLDDSGPVDFTAELVDTAQNAAAGVVVGRVVVDADVPVLSALTVTPARIRGTGTVTATFDASEQAAVDGLAVSVGGRAMACGPYASSSPRYTCTRPMAGDELPAGAEAAQAVVVLLADAAGNTASASGSVVFDFRPPGVVASSLTLTPAADNSLTAVARARAGTRATFTVVADEPLDPASPPTLTVTSGGNTLAVAYVEKGSTATTALFEVVVPAGTPDGDYAPSLGRTDLAGNAATGGAGLPTLRVKTSAPTLTVNQAALTFLRSPLGNAAAESRGGYVIPAGPYVAVEPSDPLSGATALPAGALALADGGALPLVFVKGGAGATAPTLGVLRASPPGTFARQALSGQDAASAWLVGADDAGNLSAPVALATTEWVGTANLPSFGESPHVLSVTRHVLGSRDQEVDASLPPRAAAAGTDAAATLVGASAAWRDRTAAASPSARYTHAMAYDAARGRTVLFGGNDGNVSPETWEYDGSIWSRVATAGPLARTQHALVYDAARQRVVLFGGVGFVGGVSTYLADTWEWDGDRWFEVATTGPAGRADAVMAYDAARGRVVLFGGFGSGTFGDTWEWDGVAWTLAASTGPSARTGAAAAFDGTRGRVLLFGGSASGYLADLWEWTGSAWNPVAGSGPSARSNHAMAWDPARRRVVLAGGQGSTGSLADTWEWNGSAWSLASAAGLGARYWFALAHDSARGRTVAFGGLAAGTSSETLEWNGAAWLPASTSAPPARSDHAMVFDAARGRCLVFGGFGTAALADTWEWSGAGWAQVATTGPSARSQHAMAYDSARGRTVLFGGRDVVGPRDDTWEWTGSAWAALAPATRPDSRRLHAMAYDSGRARTVLFGGVNDIGRLGDTWEWTGAAWSLRAATGPSARSGASMAYDVARARTVLYGGSPGGTETWEWDGAAWALRASSGPTLRGNLVYDAERGRVMLLGGAFLQEPWEWNGSAWTRVASTAPVGTRSATAVAFDRNRNRWVVFGGFTTARVADTWEWSSTRPAAQLDVSFASASVDPARIQALTVRAFAGGALAPGAASSLGARLLAWSSLGPNGEPGGWVPLADNTTGVAAAAPYLPAAPLSLVSWTSASAAEARRFVGGRAATISLQVRPASSAAATPGAPVVALDYLEVRVRYTTP